MGRGPVTVNILYLVMRQYVAPPSGGLYLVSMWHNVAAPFGGILYLVARFAVHVPHIVAVDNSPPFGGTISSS